MEVGHHRVPRSRGGSWHHDNIMEVDQKLERRMHDHEGTRLFHEKVIHLIDEWHTTDVIPEVRERIRNVVQEVGPEMYNPRAVLSWRHINGSFKKQGGIYIPNHYHNG